MTAPSVEVVPDGARFRWVLVDGAERSVGPHTYSDEMVAKAAGVRQVRAMNTNEGVEAHKTEEDLL